MRLKSLLIPALLAFSFTASLAPHMTLANRPLPQLTAQPSTIKPAAQLQLADEIIRRLRRMGFNMIQSRTARPVEIVGEYA